MTTMNRPVVSTESGAVRGIVEEGVAAFRGIPYAASPVGDLRFAAPRRHPRWDGTRDASRSGPSVPQNASRLEVVMGARTPDWDEDGCLNLTVWTPWTNQSAPSAPSAQSAQPLQPVQSAQPAEGPHDKRALPVLLWFHGGGFTSGSGGWDWYDGRHLAAAGDIVVVTANYRLGPLGYLSLPELGVQNLGVRDQAAALGWIERNIASFGGDPTRITVGGQSAGAFSSFYLAASPVTGPRIQRVIMQSSPFGLPPQNPDEAADHARRFVDILGLTGSLDLLEALRAVPAENMLSAYGQLAGELARPGSVAPPMYPVLGGFGIEEAWRQALDAGRLEGKQILTGTTKNEMTAFFAFNPAVQALSADQARALVAAQIEDGADRYDRTAARLHNAAPGAVLTELETELVFRDGTLAVADHQAAAGNATYVYQFDRAPAEDPAHLGAAHCAELPFFFNTIDAYPDSPMLGEPTAAARDLADTFSRAAASFVAGGRPDADGWQPYRSGDSSTVRHFG